MSFPLNILSSLCQFPSSFPTSFFFCLFNFQFPSLLLPIFCLFFNLMPLFLPVLSYFLPIDFLTLFSTSLYPTQPPSKKNKFKVFALKKKQDAGVWRECETAGKLHVDQKRASQHHHKIGANSPLFRGDENNTTAKGWQEQERPSGQKLTVS